AVLAQVAHTHGLEAQPVADLERVVEYRGQAGDGNVFVLDPNALFVLQIDLAADVGLERVDLPLEFLVAAAGPHAYSPIAAAESAAPSSRAGAVEKRALARQARGIACLAGARKPCAIGMVQRRRLSSPKPSRAAQPAASASSDNGWRRARAVARVVASSAEAAAR